MAEPPSLEDRVERLEQLAERVIELARCHPVGRAVLRALKLDGPRTP